MSIPKVVKEAVEEAMVKVHVEDKANLHAWLKQDGLIRCPVCAEIFREAARDV